MPSPATYAVIEQPPDPRRDRDLARGVEGRASRLGFLGSMALWDLAIVVCALHGWAIWVAMGGYEGMTSDWPLLRDDHPLYYHTALVTRSFLAQSGTTAGYDPAFMAGYPKSIVFPSSSTLPELVVYFFGGARPALAYKVYVFIGVAAFPWLFLAATALLRATGVGGLVAVCLSMLYFWTDWPINYAMFGMVPYLLAIPLGLIAVASTAAYIGRGGMLRWLVAALSCGVCVLVHFTSAMIVAPAALACYLTGIVRLRGQGQGERFPASRHLGVVMIPVAVLLMNAFWWLPGIYLASTKGDSSFTFVHTEPVVGRILQIFVTEAYIQVFLVGLGLVGLVATIRRTPIAGVGLAVFALSGFFWGYMAGMFRALDFLQPGRHTYAFYSCLTVAAGLGWAEVCRRLRAIRGRLDVWATVALFLVGFRLFAVPFDASVAIHLARPTLWLEQWFPGARKQVVFNPWTQSFLTSRPNPNLMRMIAGIKRHVQPGERLLYEEVGKGRETSPFGDGRYSGLLPERCGVEVLGGPYLHASLTTNFTQFGEGKLFGDPKWGRDQFVKYARLYRPAAIVCWSARARSFCKENPDLVEIKDDDGEILIGRVKGFEGATIRGEAKVVAGPNRLVVSDVKPDLDGLAVLRYHSVPCLRSRPEGRWEPLLLEGDPVPFIGVRPGAEPIELELAIPLPWAGRRP
jgi:hypothetical protein